MSALCAQSGCIVFRLIPVFCWFVVPFIALSKIEFEAFDLRASWVEIEPEALLFET
jgi:hypothetical protein